MITRCTRWLLGGFWDVLVGCLGVPSSCKDKNTQSIRMIDVSHRYDLMTFYHSQFRLFLETVVHVRVKTGPINYLIIVNCSPNLN